MNPPTAVILGAGKGTRMKSKLPKLLHPLAGWPMIRYILQAVREAGVERVVLVVGHQKALVRRALGEAVEYVEQAKPLGTGHALLQARGVLGGATGALLVLCGDTPLINGATLRRLVSQHQATGAALTILTACGESHGAPGRVLRDAEGRVAGVVEEQEASPTQQAIPEWNSGIYCFQSPWLWEHLAELPIHPNGEYYLTDMLGLAVRLGQGVEALVSLDPRECLGINDRVQLALAEGVLQQRIREQLMQDGVTLVDPPSTFIDSSVEVGQDTVIYPNTTLAGHSRVGRDCHIGPNSIVIDSVVGDRCRLVASLVRGAVLAEDVTVGPFSHIRPEVHLAAGVHIGNFVELKKSSLGRGTKAGHFSYVGDAQVGAGVNIGAGTITANYDGRRKHRTVIEEGAFIGSDCTLVAPVKIGRGATTGAGSVVTHDVPEHAVAYGVPARVRRIKENKGDRGGGRRL